MSRLIAGLLLCGLLVPIAGDAAGARRALLIGINQYQTDEFSDLRGAVNDVKSIQDVLTSRFGFEPDNLTTLTDGDATRAAILAALDKLAATSTSDDVVYVHYSGHGSQVPDVNGDEPDNIDETILPHDGRMDGIADITDDELGDFLKKLAARTAVIVLDSCHSGTATRGGVVTRSVPADTRLELYRRPQDTVTTRAIVQLDIPERYVLLSGAAANQNALDGPVDGKYHGFFSYALTQALSSVGTGLSPRGLQDSVKQTYQGLSEKFGGMPLPEPQIEAAAELLDQPLFPARGSNVAEPPVATLVADLPEPIGATVRWGRVEASRRVALEKKIKAYAPDIEFVAEGDFARFVVDVEADTVKVHGAAGLTVIEEFALTSNDKAAKKLARLFSRSIKSVSLTALTNPVSALRIDARIVGADNGRKRIRAPNSQRSHDNSLMLEISVNQDAYITVVDVDPDGGVNVLFPNDYTKGGFLPQGILPAQETVRIPDTLQRGNRAGFFWDYSPPTGTDTIQVFASTDLGTAETIRKWIGGLAATSARGGGSGEAKQLHALQSALAQRIRQRGVAVVADIAADTGTGQADPNIPANADWNSVSLRVRVVD